MTPDLTLPGATQNINYCWAQVGSREEGLDLGYQLTLPWGGGWGETQETSGGGAWPELGS